MTFKNLLKMIATSSQRKEDENGKVILAKKQQASQESQDHPCLHISLPNLLFRVLYPLPSTTADFASMLRSRRHDDRYSLYLI